MTNEHADAALLIDAYGKIAAQIDEAGQSFVEAAPEDGARQLRLQSKLMTAVLANFIGTMPGVTPEQLLYMFHYAMSSAMQALTEPDDTLN